jgi:hypothetical protein
MGLTHDDFFRSFPAVAQGAPWRHDGTHVWLDDDGGPVVIELGSQQARRIASLELPVTTLRFRFSRHAAPQIESFMQRFDLAFRRGGG